MSFRPILGNKIVIVYSWEKSLGFWILFWAGLNSDSLKILDTRQEVDF
jgi:hypothetical protein